MNATLHKSNTRGHANHGWLDTYHTFSFANYFDPNRVNFGTLRVLNDDIVQPSQGFGMHPHDNMEIITIILKGALEHKDSMGHISVIKENEVQVMSAGTGLYHAEYNHSAKEEVNLLQIWIFPRSNNLDTRYDQKQFSLDNYKNKFALLVNPDYENGLYIQQDAWILRGNLVKDFELNYSIKKKENGLYVFVINGNVNVSGTELRKRDGIGINDADEVVFHAVSDCDLILLDIPMT